MWEVGGGHRQTVAQGWPASLPGSLLPQDGLHEATERNRGAAKRSNFTKGTEPTSREQVSRSERWDSWGWGQGSSRMGKGGPAKSIRPAGGCGAPSSSAHSRAGTGRLKKTPRSSGRSTCQTPPPATPHNYYLHSSQ